MSQKIIFKNSGVKGKKEIEIKKFLKNVMQIQYESEFFWLKRKTGRPKQVWHESWYKELCKNEGTNDIDILKYTVETRKDILDKYNFYNKEYITSESFERLVEYIEKDSSIQKIYP